MIVLDRIDPASQRVDFRVLGSYDVGARRAYSRGSTLARQLGLGDVRLLDEPGAGAASTPCANPPVPERMPRHHWERVDGVLQCELVFAHEPASRDLAALWLPLVLVSSGAGEDRLAQVHTALYEICANILEHGRLRREPATFTIVLRFHPDRIDGYVQDCCERFDSATAPLQGVLERFATRARRGFGIHMMHRLIDHLQHEYNETGNRLVFTKGIMP